MSFSPLCNTRKEPGEGRQQRKKGKKRTFAFIARVQRPTQTTLRTITFSNSDSPNYLSLFMEKRGFKVAFLVDRIHTFLFFYPTTSHCSWRKGASKLPFLRITSTPFSGFFYKYILLGFLLFITEIEILS